MACDRRLSSQARPSIVRMVVNASPSYQGTRGRKRFAGGGMRWRLARALSALLPKPRQVINATLCADSCCDGFFGVRG